MSATPSASIPDRLALARALVADIPGACLGWNACRATMLKNGGKADDPG